MVKTRQGRALAAESPIPVIAFDDQAQRSGVEVVSLQRLIAREIDHDLTRPQRPTFHHLMFFTRGRGTHTVDLQRHRLRPGSVLYIAPGQIQQFSLDRALEAWLIVFEPHFVREAPRIWPGPRTFPGPRGATIEALFEAAAREFQASGGGAAAAPLLRAIVEAILLAVGASPEADGLDPGQTVLERFTSALEGSFTRAHEVAAYAALLDCSPRTLTRACERGQSRSAKQVIDGRILLEAKRLLAHGGVSAAEVSAQLGFAEPTQFGKFFKRLAGETPAAFRARFEAK
jgi:AraC-like DNA-binding protein